MTVGVAAAVDALNRRFLIDYPAEAAAQLERLDLNEAAEALAHQPVHVVRGVWTRLTDDVATQLLPRIPVALRSNLLRELEPAEAAGLLARLTGSVREDYLGALGGEVEQEIRQLMTYPPQSAGSMMDPRVIAFRGSLTVREAEARLRASRPRPTRELFVIDDERRPEGRIEIQHFAVADHDAPLSSLVRPIIAAVQDVAPREEVVEKIEQHKLPNLPVVDYAGRLVGVIHHEGLVEALAEEASLDIQTMVGASRDERALSPIGFAVKKRLPWLEINLATAFLAASVVGIFESTIAKFTALAVLLPVVAGQSGNAGAQALAVTMRGLALREISMRHALKVVFKEINVGLLNGVAIALTTGAGVYIWSRSFGLALVISTSMVLAMVAAGLAGALIPITLQRLGQDPAQSSSIILTTVTDIVGFFSFLGIATLLASLL